MVLASGDSAKAESHSRRRPESNRCNGFCRPAPNHSATSPGGHPTLSRRPGRQVNAGPIGKRTGPARELTVAIASSGFGSELSIQGASITQSA